MTGLTVSRVEVKTPETKYNDERNVVQYQHSKVPSLYSNSKVPGYVSVRCNGQESGKKFPIGICRRSAVLGGLKAGQVVYMSNVTNEAIAQCYRFLSHGFIELQSTEEEGFVSAAVELEIVGFQEERNTAYDDQYSSESDEEVISHRQIEAAENGKIETETSESETDDDEKVNCMTSANATSKNAIDRQMNREEQEEEEEKEDDDDEEEEEKEEDRRKDRGRENVGERDNEKSNDSSYMTTESSSDNDGECADDEEDEIPAGSEKSVDNVAAKKIAVKAKKKNAVRKIVLTKEQIQKFNPYNRPSEVVAIEPQDGENVVEMNPENKLTVMQLSPTVNVAKLTLLQMAAANSVPLENNQFGNSKPEIASKLMETNSSSQRTSKIPVDSPSQQKHFIRCPFSNADLKKFASEGFTGQKLVDKLYAESYQRLFSKSGLIEKDLAALNFGDFESDLFFFLQVKDASEITRYGSFGFKRTFREVIRDSGKRSVMKSAEYCIVCEQGMNNQKDAYCHEIKHGTPYSIITEYAKSDPTSILSHYGPMNYFSPGMKMIKGKDKRKKSEEEGQIASGDDSPERKKKCDNAKTYSKRKKSGKNVKKTKISQ